MLKKILALVAMLYAAACFAAMHLLSTSLISLHLLRAGTAQLAGFSVNSTNACQPYMAPEMTMTPTQKSTGCRV